MENKIRTNNSYRFFKAGKKIKDLLHQEMDKKGICHGHAMILHVLNDYGCLSQVQLARILSITPASISSIIQGMRKEGLINRIPDPKDERIMLTSLTEKGMNQAVIVIEVWEKVEREFSKCFSPAEYEALSRLLNSTEKLLTGEEKLKNES